MSRAWTMVLLALMVAVAGCVCPPKDTSACMEGRDRDGVGRAYVPTGNKCTSPIMVEKHSPSTVRVGEPFDYTVKVTNLTDSRLQDVSVRDTVPNHLSIQSCTPPGTQTGNLIVWNLGTLGPRETRTIAMKAVATGTSVVRPCTEVAFRSPPACMAICVIQPKLDLQKFMCAKALACDTVEMRLVVRNTGTGMAKNVKVTDRLPEGVTTDDGKNELMFNVGDLNEKQSKTFTAKLRFAGAGNYCNTAMATGDGGLSATASTNIAISKPVLTLAKTAPETRYIDRPIEYTLTVTNTSDTPATDVVLTDPVPRNAVFVSASEGGKVNGNIVTWNLGTLAAGASRTVCVTMKGCAPGTIENTATVNAYCAGAQVTACTAVKGIPAVLLEMVDVCDPLEVGKETLYEISVTNQGSAADTNIRIEALLPPQQRFLSSDGPTKATANGQTVTFAPLGRLEPGQKAMWKVRVQATDVGDVRFQTTLNTDQLGSPVTETEATHQYK